MKSLRSLLLFLLLILSLLSLSLSLKSIIWRKPKTSLKLSWEHYYDSIDGFGADHIIEDSTDNRGRRISSMVSNILSFLQIILLRL